MNEDLKSRAKEINRAICDILFDEWDPIGVNDLAPRDEYDGYAGGIYGLLRDRAGIEDIAAHLFKLEASYMGCTTNDDHRKTIARKLLDVDISLPNQ